MEIRMIPELSYEFLIVVHSPGMSKPVTRVVLKAVLSQQHHKRVFKLHRAMQKERKSLSTRIKSPEYSPKNWTYVRQVAFTSPSSAGKRSAPGLVSVRYSSSLNMSQGFWPGRPHRSP